MPGTWHGNLYLLHMSKPMWHFRPGSAEYTADDAGVRALAGLAAPDIFFREALQNSIDEAKPGRPASVRISLIALSGKERTRFLKAFGWDEFRKQLALQGVAGEQPPGRRRALKAIDSGQDLLLLRYEDRGTSGLVGDEWNPRVSNFASFFRTAGIGVKRDANRAGSHGIGKQVWQSQSDIHAFMSLTRCENEEGHLADRLYGLTNLGTRFDDERKYAPTAGFGIERVQDGSLATASVWAPDLEVLDALQLGPRPAPQERGSGSATIPFPSSDEAGTVFVVPAFQIGEIDTDSDEDHLLVAKVIAKWFWPAICMNRLKVVIDSGRGAYEIDPVKDERLADSDFDPRPHARILKAALDQQVNLISGKFKAPKEAPLRWDVAMKASKAPRCDAEDHQKPPAHETPNGAATVALRSDESAKGGIAIFRGSGMVIRYEQGVPKLAGFVATGEAAAYVVEQKPSSRQSNLESVLRLCEPPNHTKWDPRTGHPTLKEHFQLSDLSLMLNQFSLDLRILLRMAAGFAEDNERVAELERRLQLPGTVEPPKPPQPKVNAVLKSVTLDKADPNAAVLTIEVSNGTEKDRNMTITPMVKGLGSSDRLEWLAPFTIKSRDGKCEAWSGPNAAQGVKITAKSEKIVRCEIVGRVSTAAALLPAAELRFMINHELVNDPEAS